MSNEQLSTILRFIAGAMYIILCFIISLFKSIGSLIQQQHAEACAERDRRAEKDRMLIKRDTLKYEYLMKCKQSSKPVYIHQQPVYIPKPVVYIPKPVYIPQPVVYICKESIRCACGSEILKSSKYAHNKSMKHQQYLMNMRWLSLVNYHK